MTLLLIQGGTLYDPANGLDGVVRDLWARDGHFVEPPTDPADRPDRVLDASGLVVMPGGVDMHCHIVGPKVNLARKLRPEDHRQAALVRRTSLCRSGTGGSVPSTFATGYLYAGLGYTTAFDAAIPPLHARHAHAEFADTPVLDKGCFLLLGNNHYVLRQVAANEPERLRAYLAWVLGAARGYAAKLVNPGGVEEWKQGGTSFDLDQPVRHFGVTSRQILSAVAQAVTDLGLPHPIHVHCNNLGRPGNWQTTLATMQALAGRRAHLTHIQFHSYGGGPDDQAGFSSQVPALAEYINAHADLSVDVGQVMFGDTTSMTGDGALGYFLHRVTGRKWTNADTEVEAGCGIVPITYKEKRFVHALQWAIGLEWYLLVKDPWRVAMSTDHPNGGSFLAYPEIIQLLMDRTYRQEALKRVPPRVLERTVLKDLDRQYTLSEIAIITRAGPARLLGLAHKGHLGVGADADVTVYTPGADVKAMFALPRYVVKGGTVVVEKGEIRRDLVGKTLYVAPAFDDGMLADVRRWFEESYSIQFGNYALAEAELGQGGVKVKCGGR